MRRDATSACVKPVVRRRSKPRGAEVVVETFCCAGAGMLVDVVVIAEEVWRARPAAAASLASLARSSAGSGSPTEQLM